MASPRILVTGATGRTGGQLAKRLIELGHSPRLSSRSGTAGRPGAECVRLDWMDESSFGPAVAGIDGVYLVSGMTLDPYPAMKAFIERAVHAGVRRFVLLSASALPEGGPAMGMVHQYLRERVAEWTVLQPSWFMQNFLAQHAQGIRDAGLIYSATGNGRVPFIDTDDIAEAALRSLMDEKPHNRAYVLTGPQVLTYGEAAEIIGRARGKPVHHMALSREELIERFAQGGIPRHYAEMLAIMDEAIAQGAEDRVTENVQLLTGRAARDFKSFAEANAGVWRT